MERGENLCPLNDDIKLIKSKIKQSDAIIFATPVYVGDVSSSMKALFDRLAYMCHRQEFYKKCVMILATTNASSLKRTIHTIGASTLSWGTRIIGSKGFKTNSSNDSQEVLNNRYHKQILKLAKKLYLGIKEKIYLKPSILSLTTFKIQQKYRANANLSNQVDYEYWKKQGWTDPKKKYYIDHNSSFITKLFSTILYRFFLVIL